MSLGLKLKKYRSKYNLSIRDVSGKVDIDIGTLSRIETGSIKNPKFCDVSKLCTLYKIKMEKLL